MGQVYNVRIYLDISYEHKLKSYVKKQRFVRVCGSCLLSSTESEEFMKINIYTFWVLMSAAATALANVNSKSSSNDCPLWTTLQNDTCM